MGATLDPVSPQVLISNLPASLQPSTTTFYFSPQQEAIQLQQAALMQTGKASFINGLSTDSTSQLSVNDQQKLVMYGNAVEYAKTNNIQLGQALTPEQIAGLSQPMLWYVEQTVPEPGCAATGNAKCPTVTALMPQVYLPENFTALSAGGQILASNDLSLNFGSTATGGSILNTGSITSGGTLTVNTGKLTNRANVVDVGEIWSYIKDAGYLKTTGTMVQPGGFMSAVAGGLTLNVDQFNQIGGALQLLGQNGEVDQAATQAFIAGVAAQLGDNFVQQTLQNDLHTDFVKQGGSFGIQQVGMIMASAMLAGALAPLMAGLVAAQLGSVAATFVAGGLGNVMASAALTAMASSTLTQAMFTGSLDFGSVLKTGLSAAVTAGLLNGITYSSADGLGFSTTASPNSLSSLAGVKPTFVEGTASQAGTASAGFSITQGMAIFGQSVIQAGVQSTIQGGSFLDALKASGVSNLSAALAFQIGDAKGDLSQIFGQNGGEIVSTIAHGALGCASAAALGNGCGGGAIGGALGSALNSIFDPSQVLPPELHVGLMGIAGALVAGALGQDANAAATAAQNETQNNWLKHKAEAFNKPSEADQLKAAASACSASGSLSSESCGKLNELRAVSLARDQALTSACADAGSAACMLAVADAKANGNLVVRASNGQMFAVDPADSQILSGDPNLKATLFDKQLGSPLGAILSALVVALGGSTETALEGAQLGQAVEGVGAGLTSFGTSATLKPVSGPSADAQAPKGNGIDFYVNSQGVALPATGYRYMDSRFAEATISSMTAPLSYFGFTKFDSGAASRSAFQIFFESGNSKSWSDARLMGVFDTLQLFGRNGFVNAKVPLEKGGVGPGVEPYTRSYPEYGVGGEAQLIPVIKGTQIEFYEVKVLK